MCGPVGELKINYLPDERVPEVPPWRRGTVVQREGEETELRGASGQHETANIDPYWRSLGGILS